MPREGVPKEMMSEEVSARKEISLIILQLLFFETLVMCNHDKMSFEVSKYLLI